MSKRRSTRISNRTHSAVLDPDSAVLSSDSADENLIFQISDDEPIIEQPDDEPVQEDLLEVWFELSAGAPSKALWIMVTYDCDTGQSE